MSLMGHRRNVPRLKDCYFKNKSLIKNVDVCSDFDDIFCWEIGRKPGDQERKRQNTGLKIDST